MVHDVIRELGYLCLGSRLKRLGERMQADVQRLMDQEGLPLQAGQSPILATIMHAGPLSVGELVEATGVSQPGVTRSVARLVDAGLVKMTRDVRDQRKKTVALTKAGRRLVEASSRDLWPRIEAAVREVCAEASGPLLDQLTAIETALKDAPLDRRAARIAEEASP